MKFYLSGSRQSWIVRVAVKAAICMGVFSPGSLTTAQGSSAGAMRPTAEQQAQADWHAKLLQIPASSQCRVATYPETVWHEVPCAATGSGKAVPSLRSSRLLHPLDESSSKNITAKSSGSISAATGSLYLLTNLGPAAAQPGPYSVQMNTNGFSSPLCKQSTNAACVAIQQFVLDSNGTFFIQTWLDSYLDTKTTKCPSGTSWNVNAGVNCWRNAVSSTWTPVPISALGGVTLTAQASAGGNDTLTVSVGGKAYSTPATNTLLGLAGLWNDVDFNVFGEQNSQEDFFYPGTLGAVAVNLNDGTSNAPTCVGQGVGGALTLETTNLTLGSCSAEGKIGTLNPGIYFYESVPPLVQVVQATSGSANGGAKVTIKGQGFTSGVAVKFGGSYASGNTVCTGGTTCTATTPAGTGTVPVTVANLTSIGAEGAFSTTAGAPQFTFEPVPSGHLQPAVGPPLTTVTITGQNFSTAPGGTQVIFTLRGQPLKASGVSCISSTQCTASAPIFADIANVQVPSTVVIVANGQSSSLGTFIYSTVTGPPVKVPPVNCAVCRENGQTCKVVNGQNVCIGNAR